MRTMLVLVVMLINVLGSSCNSMQEDTANKSLASSEDIRVRKDSVIYQSDQLIVLKISPGTYQHISYLETNDFGKVACNGMIVINNNEAILFDTPTDDKSSEELISFVQEKLNAKITGLIPTHFHKDCIGGLATFNKYNIPVYANERTLSMLKQKDNKDIRNIKSFRDSIILPLGQENVVARFLGEGHTKDNIIGYFKRDHVLFGGCLIKEMRASKGNLEDANIKGWPETVRRVRDEFPNVKIVIPGHGHAGGKELLDYTEMLFQN